MAQPTRYLTDEGGDFVLTEGGFRIIIEGGQFIVDTECLELPVNCVMADHEKIRRLMSEFEVPPHRVQAKAAIFRSGTTRLKGAKPSFTVKTDHRGFG